MKTSKFLAVAALSLLAVAGVQAETYEGVHPLTNGASRADVAAQAVAAAHSANPYAEGFNAGPAQPVISVADRSAVRAGAVAAARAGDLYSEAASAGVAPVLASGLSRDAVRAEARAAAASGKLEAL